MDGERTSVDWRQVRSLVRAGLRQTVRGSLIPFAGGTERGPSRWAFVVLIGTNVFYSLMLAAVMAKSADLFSGLVIGGTLILFVMAMQILIEFGQVVVTPDDYAVIGAMPVNSRTYYIAKLSQLVTLVSILTGAASIVPAVVTTIFRHSITAFFIVLVHFWVVSMTISLAVAVAYAWLMVRFNRRRVERWLGYIQFAFGLIIWAGIFILPDKIGPWLGGIDAAAHPVLQLSPGYWFAAWVRLFERGWNGGLFCLGMLGVAVLVILFRLISGSLSLTYAESLSAGTASRTTVRRSAGNTALGGFIRRLATAEDRAVFALTKAQFRHDTRFRMSILGSAALIFIIPVLVYIHKESFPQDPFLGPSRGAGTFQAWIGYFVCMAAMGVQMNISMSNAWRAAWIYFVAPADHRNLVRAANRVVTVLLILPVLVGMWILFSFIFGAVFNAFLHAAYLSLLAMIALILGNLAKSNLPFATEYKSGSSSFGMFAIYLLDIFLVLPPIIVISRFGYGGYGGWALWMIGTGIVYWLLTILRDRRVARGTVRGEFAG